MAQLPAKRPHRGARFLIMSVEPEWAMAIVHGWKTLENRPQQCLWAQGVTHIVMVVCKSNSGSSKRRQIERIENNLRLIAASMPGRLNGELDNIFGTHDYTRVANELISDEYSKRVVGFVKINKQVESETITPEDIAHYRWVIGTYRWAYILGDYINCWDIRNAQNKIVRLSCGQPSIIWEYNISKSQQQKRTEINKAKEFYRCMRYHWVNRR